MAATTNDAVPVTAEAREAAADLLNEVSSLLGDDGIGQVADLIRDGEYDEHDATLAFARFERDILARHRGSTAVVDAQKIADCIAAAIEFGENGLTVNVEQATHAIVTSLSQTPATPMVQEGLREALDVGEKFLNACFSAWSCGEPYHRVKTMMDRADEFRAALDALAATPAPPVDETDKLETHIWQRADEWVLEISGSINGTHFISRHTEPLTTPKENVAGLPSLYAALADRTQEGEVRRG